MSIDLGAVDHRVHVTAESDGWWIRPTPTAGADVDLARRDRWPEDARRTPEAVIAALQTETLLDLGIAEAVGGAVVVPWDRFGSVLREEIPLPLRWTMWSPLMLAIDTASQIGRDDFEYRYEFRLGAREAAVDRVGYFVRRRATGQCFHLDEQTFALVDAMDRLNALGPAGRLANGWLTFATVRGCSEAVGAALDVYLLDNHVVIPSQIALDVYAHNDESISFVPRCPELPVKEFREAFLRNPDAQGLYSIDGENGKRVRVLLSERHLQVLRRMKAARRLRGAARAEAERNPARFFDGLLDSVEIQYGPRVTGVGEFQFVAVPADPRESGGFFEGAPSGAVGNASDPGAEADGTATVGGRRDGPSEMLLPGLGAEEVRVRFGNARELAVARSRMAEALAVGEPAVTLAGQTVSVSQAALDALTREPEASADSVGGSRRPGKYLLVYTNESETREADVQAAAAAATSTAWPTQLVLPRALKQGVQLKGHQRDALLWLQRCEMLRPNRRGVLLADDMGLGKTVQVTVQPLRDGRLEGGAGEGAAERA